VAGEVLKQGAAEFTTEGLQTLVEQHARHWVETDGRSLLENPGAIDWREVIEALAAGALGGGAMGGGGQLLAGNPGADDLNTRIENAGARAVEQGGDALEAELAKAEAAAREAPRAAAEAQSRRRAEKSQVASDQPGAVDPAADILTAADLGVEVPEASAWGNTDRPKVQSWQPDTKGIENTAREAEAFGQQERSIRLRNLQRLYQRAARLLADGQEEAGLRMRDRANAIHAALIGSPAPEPGMQLPMVRTMEGTVEGSPPAVRPDAPVPADGIEIHGRRAPGKVSDARRRALPAPAVAGLLGNEGMIYGEAPPGRDAARETTRRAMEDPIPTGTDWRPGVDARLESEAMRRAHAEETKLEAIPGKDQYEGALDPDPELLPIVDKQGVNRLFASRYIRGAVEDLASRLSRNGGVSYIFDDQGKITGRTPSENPAWFQNGDLGSTGYIKATVRKALEGRELGTRQKRVIDELVAIADEQRIFGEQGPTWDNELVEAEYGDDVARMEAQGLAERRGRYDNRTGDLFADRVPAPSDSVEVSGVSSPPITLRAEISGLEAEWDGRRVPVRSLADARGKWIDFRETTNAGASALGNGVRIYLRGRPVARISYNGRVWDNYGKSISDEPASGQNGQSELFGERPATQLLADEQRVRDDRRSPGTDVPADTDDGLFSNRQRQIHLDDAARREDSPDTDRVEESTAPIDALDASRAEQARRRYDDRTGDLFAQLDELENARPYDDIETRPGTTGDQRVAGRDALAGLLRLLRSVARRSGASAAEVGPGGTVSVLGLRIARRFSEGRPAQLVGQEVSSPADLASLAQVYRDPRFETFRILLMRGSTVVGERALTSRLAAAVSFRDTGRIDELVADAVKRAGADGYYIMHNHPSGKSTPSMPDIRVTQLVAASVPGFRGHVVIDHNEYSVIDSAGEVSTVEAPEFAGVDFYADPAVPNDSLGRSIYTPEDAGRIARAVARDDQAVIITTAGGSEARVQVITSVPIRVLDHAKEADSGEQRRLLEAVLIMARNTGSGGNAFVVLPASVAQPRDYAFLRGRFARDVFSADGQPIDGAPEYGVGMPEGEVRTYVTDDDRRPRRPAGAAMVESGADQSSDGQVHEDTGDYPSDRLSVLHNLSADNLLFADQMGGLPVPSLAIVRDGMGMEGFGEITLIGDKALGDPSRQPTYDADAYTQRMPQPDYAAASRKKAEAVINQLRPWSEKYESAGRSTGFLWDATGHTQPREVVSNLIRSNGMKAWFINETMGITPNAPKRPKPLRDSHSAHPDVVAFFKSLPDKAFERGSNSEAAAQARKDLGAIYTRIIREEYADRSDIADLLIKQSVDPVTGEMYFGHYDRVHYDQRRVGELEVDSMRIEKALNFRLRGKEAKFHAWVSDKVMSLYGEPKIKVGGRKVPYTLSNIVDAMRAGRDAHGKEATMTFSDGMARAAASTRFTDLEWMRNAAQDALKGPEEVEAAREAAKAKLEEYRQAVIKHYAYSDTWSALDDSMAALADWARNRLRKSSRSAMREALRKKDFKGVPEDVIDLALEAGDAMLAAPVPYFEAKPQRAVGIGEFAGAVVPHNVDRKVLEVLERNGLTVERYRNTDREAQSRATDKLRRKLAKRGREVLFQRGESPVNAHSAETLHYAMDRAFPGVASALEAGGRLKVIKRSDIPASLRALNSITAWHGSPHRFDRFDMTRIGSGEGAQSFGHGLYFAEKRGIGRRYRDVLAQRIRAHFLLGDGTRLDQRGINDLYDKASGGVRDLLSSSKVRSSLLNGNRSRFLELVAERVEYHGKLADSYREKSRGQ
jgi:hypothetical protein